MSGDSQGGVCRETITLLKSSYLTVQCEVAFSGIRAIDDSVALVDPSDHHSLGEGRNNS